MLHLMAAAALARDPRRPPGQPQATSSRARRRSASVHLEPWLEANRERLDGRPRGHQRHGLLRGQPPGHHGRPARAAVRQIDVVGARCRPPLGRRTAAPSRTRPSPSPRSSRGSRAPTAGSASRASTTTSCRSTEAERAALAALPFDEEAYRAEIGVAGAPRRARLHDPRAQGRPADARRQRHLGRLPGRGRQDDHPGPRPRQGQLPPRRRPGPRTASSSGSATTSLAIAPPGVDVERHATRRRPAEPDPDRPSRRRRPPRGRSRRPSARRPLYIREGGSIPVARQLRDRSSGCRSCCSASRSPTTTPTRPTSGWTSTTTRRRSGRSSAPSTSSRPSPLSRRRPVGSACGAPCRCGSGAVRVGDIGRIRVLPVAADRTTAGRYDPA